MTIEDKTKVNNALQILRRFLPHNCDTIWPADIKKLPSSYGTVMTAWNGTCGASLTLGWKAKEITELYKKPGNNIQGVRKWIYEAIARPTRNIRPENAEEYMVCDLKEVVAVYPDVYRPFHLVNQDTGNQNLMLAADDLLKLVGVAESIKLKSVSLTNIQTIQCPFHSYIMLTFTLDYLNVHILSAPMNF